MKQPVFNFIKKHQLLSQSSTILVGVSGGADSMALLHFLHSNREKWDLNVAAISVNHQLRGEDSQLDVDYVQQFCEERNIPFISDSFNVTRYKEEKKISTELAAREVRYRFYAKQMELQNADYLALGHHGDDQIETMLMSLTRAASSNAFSGIPVKREFSTGWIIRPFLCISKSDILLYCKENGITPRVDESNFDTTYTRNYFRKHVLPLIKEKNKNIHTTIQQLSQTQHEDEIFLQERASEMVREIVTFDPKGQTASFNIDSFKNRAHALQRRALHLILNYLYKELPKDLSYMHEELFLSLLKDNKGNSHLDFPSQLKVDKTYGRITFHFHKSNHQDSSFHQILPVPGEAFLPNGSSVSATLMEDGKEDDKFSVNFSLSPAAFPLHIRTRKSGDRMSWKGLNGTRKVKNIFIDEKIPINERNSWPIVVDNNGEILWLIGLKKGITKAYQENGQRIRLQFVTGKK